MCCRLQNHWWNCLMRAGNHSYEIGRMFEQVLNPGAPQHCFCLFINYILFNIHKKEVRGPMAKFRTESIRWKFVQNSSISNEWDCMTRWIELIRFTLQKYPYMLTYNIPYKQLSCDNFLLFNGVWENFNDRCFVITWKRQHTTILFLNVIAWYNSYKIFY